MKVTVPKVLFALIFCEIQNLPGVFATAAEETVFEAQPPSSTEMEDPTEMPATPFHGVEAPGVEASATQEHMAEIPGPADALAVLRQEWAHQLDHYYSI